MFLPGIKNRYFSKSIFDRSAVTLFKVFHKVDQSINTCHRHGIVNTGAAATDDTMTFELGQTGSSGFCVFQRQMAWQHSGFDRTCPRQTFPAGNNFQRPFPGGLRFQAFQLQEVFREINRIDDELSCKLDYAFDEQLGFLTSCPTNVGTGLRASVMLHLPALTMTHAINRLIQQVGQLGLTVRGIYGEGSEASGNIYQISNQLTLGLSEAEIIQNVRAVVENLVEQERRLRRELMTEKRLDMCDAICRALAILKSARKMDTKEALRLLSSVNIGVSEKVISGMTSAEIYNTMLAILPANLSRKGMTAEQRDERRAQLLRKMTAKAVIVEE